MEGSTILIGIIAGSIGMGYMVYGKKQSKLVAFMAGLGLCGCPYVVDSLAIVISMCVLLIVAPFVFRS
jgi:hypothetical protein